MNYIGSKYSILDYIDYVVDDFCKLKKKNIIFCDIFSGTNIVGKYFKRKGYNIISNDILYFSYITAKAIIENNEELTFLELKKDGIEPFSYLNNLKGVEGFIYNNYANGGTRDREVVRQFFSDENALKIDAIRLKIEEWKNLNKINSKEYDYLIASLIEAADKVANTASVYEAFLKKLKGSASKKMELKPLDINIYPNKTFKAYNKDANVLIKEIKGDILYLDPPYNTRKYDTNYHMLETIALYDNPLIKGKAGVRVEENKKSKYCIKKDALNALEDLIKNANFKYILLSYNDEGIISIEDIKKVMSKYGHYKCYEKNHRRYKADTKRKYSKKYTIEYIHCLEK